MIIKPLLILRYLKFRDQFILNSELLRYIYIIILAITFISFGLNLQVILEGFNMNDLSLGISNILMTLLSFFTIRSLLFDKINIRDYAQFMYLPINKRTISILILNSKFNYYSFLIFIFILLFGLDFNRPFLYYLFFFILILNIKYSCVFLNAFVPINVLYVLIAVLVIIFSYLTFFTQYSLYLLEYNVFVPSLVYLILSFPVYVVLISRKIYFYE